MIWNEHSDRKGTHAILSPSSYHWLNYDDEKLISFHENIMAKQEGVELHELASILINKKKKLAKLKDAFNLFVNDCIGFRMRSEQPLEYSENIFGTADAISFRDGVLMIFDLKTGTTRVSFKQLDVYAALFCLEYQVDPTSIKIVQRIYQFSEYVEVIADGEYIKEVMDRIVRCDYVLEKAKQRIQKG